MHITINVLNLECCKKIAYWARVTLCNFTVQWLYCSYISGLTSVSLQQQQLEQHLLSNRPDGNSSWPFKKNKKHAFIFQSNRTILKPWDCVSNTQECNISWSQRPARLRCSRVSVGDWCFHTCAEDCYFCTQPHDSIIHCEFWRTHFTSLREGAGCVLHVFRVFPMRGNITEEEKAVLLHSVQQQEAGKGRQGAVINMQSKRYEAEGAVQTAEGGNGKNLSLRSCLTASCASSATRSTATEKNTF